MLGATEVPVPSGMIDERTLAGWLSGPTERRAAAATVGTPVLIQTAELEEHVADPITGVVRRCDLTLRDQRKALLAVELKRPEVAAVTDAALIADAYGKAISRGLELYATCNFTEAALWRAEDGTRPRSPVIRRSLADGMTHSRQARARRPEIEAGWNEFLNDIEEELSRILGLRRRPRASAPSRGPAASD